MLWGLRDPSSFKSPHCPSRGHEFDSQHPCQVATTICKCNCRESDASGSWVPIHMWHTQTDIQICFLWFGKWWYELFALL